MLYVFNLFTFMGKYVFACLGKYKCVFNCVKIKSNRMSVGYMAYLSGNTIADYY